LGPREDSQGEARPIVYCLVPWDLAASVHEPLRRHFGDDAGVEVVVERRRHGRRKGERRSDESAAPTGEDRRRIRNVGGRRIADRRAPLIEIEAPGALPRKARAHAARLVFVERIQPSTEKAEDADTGRLVTRIQAGDREGFADLYMRYFDRVYSYLRVVLRNEHHAEDATQQVFMKALEALPRYERRSQPFSAWLFVIARNQALADLARLQRSKPVDPSELQRRHEPSGPAEPDDHALGALDWISDRELLMFIERLPQAQRQALVLRYMLDLSTAQIAELLDRTPDDVRMLQSRGLRFLRRRLAAIGRGPSEGQRTRMRAPLRKSRVMRMRRYALG
jgi:RNA polymerase sigma-70 factor (ECF subfamily)